MPWNAPNPAPKCPFCEKSVFPAESYMAADRRPFHKQCVKCFDCTKNLVPATINEHQGALYCHFCYSNKFMPQVRDGRCFCYKKENDNWSSILGITNNSLIEGSLLYLKLDILVGFSVILIKLIKANLNLDK